MQESIEPNLPSYEEIELCFKHAKIMMLPSEAHGLLAGFVCAGKQASGQASVSAVLGTVDVEDQAVQPCKKLLLALYNYTEQKITEMAFDFTLLLPPDQEDIMLRAEAMGLWCHGFISALALSGIDIEHGITQEGRDALLHISEISKIEYQDIEISEDDEKALLEVTEYVRMAVIMIFSEFASSQGTGKNIMSGDGDKIH